MKKTAIALQNLERYNMNKMDKLERVFRKTPWDKLVSFIHEYVEVLNRVIYWAWAMKRSYDFDANTIYDMLYRKLDRLYICFINNGHCGWNSDANKPLMRKLSIARNLAKRLSNNNYTTQEDRVTTIYGNVKLQFTPSKRDNLHNCDFYMEKAPPEQQKKALNLLYIAQIRDDQQRKLEKEYLFKLLHKHLESFKD